ncbi:LysR family transcriptional regulator [Paucibacter sp. AS339]|uniref:LysR family transcriptional regulator n=1 Tax=Paucibacter hankyongi TaxID=3133434 RepID=UPI00309D2053
MDRLHLISVFVAVVDANGFAGAARKLNISPPAVTRAINELETHLGVRLLTRTTRVVRVTDAGTRYVEDCRRILADLAEADESVSGLHSAPQGRLTVTAPVLFGAMHMTPILTEYLQRYPEVQASCMFLDRVVNMMEEGVDVALRIGELPDSSLQAVRVGSVRRIICAAPEYLARQGEPQRPGDLAQHTLVSAGGVLSWAEWRVMEHGLPRIMKLQPRLSTTSNDSAINAALAGFGLTRQMSYQVADHVREGRLKIVLSDFEMPALPVHLLHREGRYGSRKVRAFLDLAIERLRANPALA